MNSLTTSPSQHAFKDSEKLLSASRPSRIPNGPDFRTYNPDIFPSLSPFSNFYKNKKQNEANAPWRRCSDSLEPVKKYKLNNGNCKVAVSQENVTSHEMTPIPIMPKAIADQQIFRVPRLPKRLCEKNQISGGSKVTNSGLRLADPQGSFADKDGLIQDSKVKQEENLSTLAQPDDDRISKTETVKKVDSNKERNGTAYPVMDTSFLTGLYEKLRLEYLLLQYNEQVHSVGGNVQKSQSDKQKTEINFDDVVTLSKDLFREHVKKEEVN